MVHKHHTFTLILGAVFGVVLSLAIAFLTFYGLTRLPWFADKSTADERTEQFLAVIANNLKKTEEGTTVVEGGLVLDEEVEQIRIYEVLGTVTAADVRGFDITATVAEAERTLHVEYTSSTLMSRVSSGVPGLSDTSLEETVIGPKQITPGQVVLINTTTEITPETQTIAARQVKQVQ